MAADRLREEDASRPAATDDQADSLPTREGRRSSSVRLLPPARAETAHTASTAESGPADRPKPEAEPRPPTLTGRKGKADRASKPAAPSRFRSLDLTGNVRMLTDQDIADLAADALERSAVARGKPAPARRPRSAAGPAVELPIAGYDQLALPSLRARLRQLNVGQLEILLSYERSHVNRDAVVSMFERRIAKLSEVSTGSRVDG